MAITENGKVRFEGAVLTTRERNYYDDSDFYAVVWNEDKQQVEIDNYATTRMYCTRQAFADATEDVIKKASRWIHRNFFKNFITSHENKAKTPSYKKQVKVIRGRKIPKGTIGYVVEIYQWKNPYSFDTEYMARIQTADRILTIPECYLEVVDWEQYVPSKMSMMRKWLKMNALSIYINFQSKRDCVIC